MDKNILKLLLIGCISSYSFGGIILEESYIEKGIKAKDLQKEEPLEEVSAPKKLKNKEDDIILDKELNVEAPLKQIEPIKENTIVSQPKQKEVTTPIVEQFSKVKEKKDTLVLDKHYGEKSLKQKPKQKVVVYKHKEQKVVPIKNIVKKEKNIKVVPIKHIKVESKKHNIKHIKTKPVKNITKHSSTKKEKVKNNIKTTKNLSSKTIIINNYYYYGNSKKHK